MTHRQQNGPGSEPSDLLHFVTHRLSELSEAFAAGPLMQLKLTVPGASVTLVKSAPVVGPQSRSDEPERMHVGRSALPIFADGEPGRQYETVCSDTVGVFHAASDLPALGEPIGADRVLGDIEALRLRTPVRAGVAGRFVGQAVEDGQPVDFGEPLFVIDSGAAPETVSVEAEPELVAELEPPRI